MTAPHVKTTSSLPGVAVSATTSSAIAKPARPEVIQTSPCNPPRTKQPSSAPRASPTPTSQKSPSTETKAVKLTASSTLKTSKPAPANPANPVKPVLVSSLLATTTSASTERTERELQPSEALPTKSTSKTFTSGEKKATASPTLPPLSTVPATTSEAPKRKTTDSTAPKHSVVKTNSSPTTIPTKARDGEKTQLAQPSASSPTTQNRFTPAKQQPTAPQIPNSKHSTNSEMQAPKPSPQQSKISQIQKPTQAHGPIVTPTQSTSPADAPVAATDVVFVNGQAFNGRGYPVCGVANQRGRRCGRIGTCPFHSGGKARAGTRKLGPDGKSRAPSKRPRSMPMDITSTTGASIGSRGTGLDSSGRPAMATKGITGGNGRVTTGAVQGSSVTLGANEPAIRQVAIPPQKSRFKRSWTTEEHRLFLAAMRRHGKGKWKEIAMDVKTRTANQCQSHAQKYFLRQAKSNSERKKKSIHDLTEPDETNPPPSASTPPVFSSAHAISPWPPGAKREPGGSPSSVALTCVARPPSGRTGDGNGAAVPPRTVFPVSAIGVHYSQLVPSFINPSLSNPAAAAAVVAPPPPPKIRVTVHINGFAKGGMALMLPETLVQFFNLARTKLSYNDNFRRVFTRSGGEITDIDEMCQDDLLWLSTGDDFRTPR